MHYYIMMAIFFLSSYLILIFLLRWAFANSYMSRTLSVSWDFSVDVARVTARTIPHTHTAFKQIHHAWQKQRWFSFKYTDRAEKEKKSLFIYGYDGNLIIYDNIGVYKFSSLLLVDWCCFVDNAQLPKILIILSKHIFPVKKIMIMRKMRFLCVCAEELIIKNTQLILNWHYMEIAIIHNE